MKTANKILLLEDLILKITEWKADNKKIVFSNGCFDILHLGHIDYLEKAQEKGDKLVIGLNTDSSVKILKGENRPINNNQSRARMLAAFSFVDAVDLFSEETPLKLIKSISPGILIKGNDYLTENIVGAGFVQQQGGKVETIELVDGFSTTNLIDKIKNL